MQGGGRNDEPGSEIVIQAGSTRRRNARTLAGEAGKVGNQRVNRRVVITTNRSDYCAGRDDGKV